MSLPETLRPPLGRPVPARTRSAAPPGPCAGHARGARARTTSSGNVHATTGVSAVQRDASSMPPPSTAVPPMRRASTPPAICVVMYPSKNAPSATPWHRPGVSLARARRRPVAGRVSSALQNRPYEKRSRQVPLPAAPDEAAELPAESWTTPARRTFLVALARQRPTCKRATCTPRPQFPSACQRWACGLR
jgi:hypothetical protein